MAEVGEVRYKTVVDTSDVESQVSGASSAVNAAVTETSKTADVAGNLIASGYAAKISSSIFSAGKSLAEFGMQYNSEMENYTTNFTTMLGSADKAASFVDDLKNMAAKTPFGTSDLADASQTLLAFGVDAESIMPTMEMLGDV